MRFIKVNESILKSVCIVLVLSSFILTSCNEKMNNSKNREKEISTKPVKTQEQIAAERKQYEEDMAQVKNKIENKITSYRAISSPRITLHEDGAETNTLVKKIHKLGFEYDDRTNSIIDKSTLGDKVFTLNIRFKKYSEYEIISVSVIDEANMVYWDLE